MTPSPCPPPLVLVLVPPHITPHHICTLSLDSTTHHARIISIAYHTHAYIYRIQYQKDNYDTISINSLGISFFEWNFLWNRVECYWNFCEWRNSGCRTSQV
jgi:hypothetical protein